MTKSFRGTPKGWKNLKRKVRARSLRSSYGKRKEKLVGLGFSSYSAYLASEQWQAIRAKVLEKCSKCVLCGKVADCVHHLDYGVETLMGLRDFNLVSLCGECHKGIEFDGNWKRTLVQANKALFSRAQCSDRGRSWMGALKRQQREYEEKDWVRRHPAEARRKMKKEERRKNKLQRTLTEDDWKRVFDLRCRSKKGETLNRKDHAFCLRAMKSDPGRYSALDVVVFEATKPFGAM